MIAPAPIGDLRTGARRLFAPTSFINTQLPASRAIDTGPDAAGALACFTDAARREEFGYPRVGGGWAYAPDVQVAAPQTPLVRVKLWQKRWTYVPKYKRQVAAILDAGVPVNVPLYALKAERAEQEGDTDLTLIAVQYDRPALDGGPPITYVWEMWQARLPTEAEAAEGYALVCSDAARYVDADRSPGWTTLKIPKGFAYNYDTNPYPTDPAQMQRFETALEQVSATATSYYGTLITGRDIVNNRIDHATAFAYHAKYVRSAHRAPARNHDGDVPGGPMIEGARFDLDPAFDVGALSLHPMAEMLARSMQNGYPAINTNRSFGALGWDAEAGISELFGGSHGTKGEMLCFHRTATQDEFPWAAIRLLPPL